MVSASGLPVFSALERHKLLGVGLEQVGDPEHRLLALRSACCRATASNAVGGGRVGLVDVLVSDDSGAVP